MILRELVEEDFAQSWGLSRVAFGGERGSTPPAPTIPRRAFGAFDDAGRLLAKVALRDYEQWWGGRAVPMVGMAGVVSLPEVRGQGLVPRLLDLALTDAPQPLSVLYPTAPGIYRRLGWEIVGTLDVTHLPTSALPTSGGPIRAGVAADLPALASLYDARAASGNGLLARTGPCFPDGMGALLSLDVCSVVEQDGQVTGYVGYQREGGYGGNGFLKLTELIASTPAALQALLGSLASWSAVTWSVHWRGSAVELALGLRSAVPAPAECQPWMLRVLDPVSAVAARGFGPGTWSEPVTIDGVGYQLEVADGRGQLTPGAGGQRLTTQGFALLYAGVSRGRLLASGHADGPVTGLEAAFAGPAPEILDYF